MHGRWRKADVIDGQQRLTTLTILFFVLADNPKEPDDKSSCMKILQEKGNKLAGIASQPRVFLREWDQPFFNNFKECLLTSVNLGDDSDTVGAIAGGLAALYYGYEGIPEDWLAVIKRREWIEELCKMERSEI